MQQNTVTLTFTDKPLPPRGGRRQVRQVVAGDKTIRALWDSIQKIIGSDDDESGREDD